MNAAKWTGKAVSIECDDKLGIFQGIIRAISEHHITIARAFRNGVPLRKQNAEITLRSQDILDIKFLPSYNGQSTANPAVINKPTPVKQPNFSLCKSLSSDEIPSALEDDIQTDQSLNNQEEDDEEEYDDVPCDYKPQRDSLLTCKMQSMQLNSSPPSSGDSSNKCSPPPIPTKIVPNQSVAQFFGFLIPPKVEVRLGTAIKNPVVGNSNVLNLFPQGESSCSFGNRNSGFSSKPIDMPPHHFKDINSSSISSSNNNMTTTNNSNGNTFGSSGTSYSSGNNGNGNGHGKHRFPKSLTTAGIASANYHNNANNIGCNFNISSSHSTNGNPNAKKQRKQQLRRENSIRKNLAFGNSADDPVKNGDFDFERNLALFDKRAIWNVIEAEEKTYASDRRLPLVVKQEKKYRHDENILASEPLQLKQIESVFDGVNNFVTDEGLIIPTIPIFVRTKIEVTAARNGFSLQRQIDILARGAADLALSLLGGARRFTPNNMHQWPKIVIICEESENYRTSNIGAATGRTLASHGLMVMLFLEEHPSIEKKNPEIGLFQATGNMVAYSIAALPKPDLVILVTNKAKISDPVNKWINDTRASVFAIDPPPCGVRDILIKYSLVPILPLNGISTNNCGKLFLCNVGLPDKFFNESGIKYKSPFGHKYVIPIHLKD